jgi:hypothetical protein
MTTFPPRALTAGGIGPLMAFPPGGGRCGWGDTRAGVIPTPTFPHQEGGEIRITMLVKYLPLTAIAGEGRLGSTAVQRLESAGRGKW